MKLLEYLAKKYVPKFTPQITLPLPTTNSRNLELSGLNLNSLDVAEVKASTSKGNLPISLNLAQNQLETLPDDFGDLCANLSSLDLNKNKLTEFPSLLNCKNLVV